MFRSAAGILCLALVGTTAACSGSAAPSAAPPSPTSTPVSSDVAELQPDGPGDETTPRDNSTPIGLDRATEEDIAFMQMMVIHHRQALDMSALAADRAGNDDVRAVAERITAAQGPEILVMADWLTDHNVATPGVNEDPDLYDHAEHGHPGMEGMLTEDQMAALAEAEGADFDVLYLEGMIAHHEGAVLMAQAVLSLGADRSVNELATDIMAEQTVEIGRLQRILSTVS